MKILASFLLLALAIPAAARIGETPEQLATRYGKAWSTNDPEVKIYLKNGIFVIARVWKGNCHRIEFSSDLSNSPYELTEGQQAPPESILPELTPNQVFSLLEANKGSSEWKKDPNAFADNETADRSRRVEGHPPRGITITTREWIDHMVEEQKKREAAVTEGF